MSEPKSLAELMKTEQNRLKKQAENRGGFDKVDWFKPEADENLIRFLPHKRKPDSKSPFVHVRLHYISFMRGGKLIQNIPARCLRDFGEDCPCCDRYEIEVKKDKEKARRLRPTERYLYNIIDYKNKKVVPYAVGIQIHEIIMGNWNDIGLDMFDVEEGRDWKIIKKEDKSKAKGFNVSYAARPMPNPSAVPPKLHSLLKDMADLDKLYMEKEEEGMIEFCGYTAGKKGRDEDEDEEDEVPSSVSKAKAAAAKAKRSRVDEDEEEEDDGIPFFSKSKKKVVVEDDEDEVPVKKKKKPVDEDEEDEAPVRKKRPIEDEEDEAPVKKKKRPVDEDEDEVPVKKKKKPAPVIEDDEEEAPPVKKKKRPIEDEEAAPPVKKKKKPVEDEDDLDELEDELKGLGV